MASYFTEKQEEDQSNIFMFYNWLQGKGVLVSVTYPGEEEF
jgi:hypothetical protein